MRDKVSNLRHDSNSLTIIIRTVIFLGSHDGLDTHSTTE
jgi:hypothetical protein